MAMEIRILHQYLLAVTDCNLACQHCWYTTGALARTPGFVSPADLDRWLDQCSDSTSISTLTITGGEPLLHPALDDLLRIAVNHGIRLGLLTNGTLLARRRAALLRDLGVEVHVSLDSVHPDYHNATRGEHERVMAALNLLEAAGIRRRAVTAAVSRSNLKEIPALIEYAAGHGFDLNLHPLALPQDDPRGLTHCDPTEKRVLRSGLRRWAEFTGRAGSYRAMMWLVEHGAPPHLDHCPFARTSLVIDADGSMYPCFQRRSTGLGQLGTDTPSEVLERKVALLSQEESASCIAVDCLGVL